MNETVASILTQLTVAHCSTTYTAVILLSVCIGVYAGALLVTKSVGKVRGTKSFA